MIEKWIEHIVQVSMVVFPVSPYFNQYLKLKHSNQGFSLHVCGGLMLSNIFKIFFWYCKRFDVTILVQGITMFAVQLWLLTVSKSTIRIRRHYPYNDVELLGLYVYLYLLTLQIIVLVTCQYVMGDDAIYVETIGFLGVVLEAAVPGFQVFRNFRNQSVKGFSELVLLVWFTGDICKIGYHLYFHNPIQFVLCGIVQVTFDLILFYQFYKYSNTIFDLNREPDEQRRLLNEDPNEYYPYYNNNDAYSPTSPSQFEAKPSYQRYVTEGTIYENAYDEAVMDPKPKITTTTQTTTDNSSTSSISKPKDYYSKSGHHHYSQRDRNIAINIKEEDEECNEDDQNRYHTPKNNSNHYHHNRNNSNHNNSNYNTSFNNSLSSFRSYQYANIRNSNYYYLQNNGNTNTNTNINTNATTTTTTTTTTPTNNTNTNNNTINSSSYGDPYEIMNSPLSIKNQALIHAYSQASVQSHINKSNPNEMDSYHQNTSRRSSIATQSSYNSSISNEPSNASADLRQLLDIKFDNSNSNNNSIGNNNSYNMKPPTASSATTSNNNRRSLNRSKSVQFPRHYKTNSSNSTGYENYRSNNVTLTRSNSQRNSSFSSNRNYRNNL